VRKRCSARVRSAARAQCALSDAQPSRRYERASDHIRIRLRFGARLPVQSGAEVPERRRRKIGDWWGRSAHLLPGRRSHGVQMLAGKGCPGQAPAAPAAALYASPRRAQRATVARRYASAEVRQREGAVVRCSGGGAFAATQEEFREEQHSG